MYYWKKFDNVITGLQAKFNHNYKSISVKQENHTKWTLQLTLYEVTYYSKHTSYYLYAAEKNNLKKEIEGSINYLPYKCSLEVKKAYQKIQHQYMGHNLLHMTRLAHKWEEIPCLGSVPTTGHNPGVGYGQNKAS